MMPVVFFNDTATTEIYTAASASPGNTTYTSGSGAPFSTEHSWATPRITEAAQPSSRAGNDAAHARRAVIALHGEYVRVRAPRASSLTRGYVRQIVSMRW